MKIDEIETVRKNVHGHGETKALCLKKLKCLGEVVEYYLYPDGTLTFTRFVERFDPVAEVTWHQPETKTLAVQFPFIRRDMKNRVNRHIKQLRKGIENIYLKSV